jgi:hypothetical protein
MNHPTNQPSSVTKTVGVIGVALILGVFVGWVVLYLLILRPMLLDYIMSSMGWSSMRFPAMLHLIPLIGGPVLLVVTLAKIFNWKRPAEQHQGGA